MKIKDQPSKLTFASKSLNLKVLRRLNALKLKTARDFALNWCVAKIFREAILVPKVRALIEKQLQRHYRCFEDGSDSLSVI